MARRDSSGNKVESHGAIEPYHCAAVVEEAPAFRAVPPVFKSEAEGGKRRRLDKEND